MIAAAVGAEAARVEKGIQGKEIQVLRMEAEMEMVKQEIQLLIK
jgi:hypothetical protein